MQALVESVAIKHLLIDNALLVASSAVTPAISLFNHRIAACHQRAPSLTLFQLWHGAIGIRHIVNNSAGSISA